MSSAKKFNPPPKELIERWVIDSKTKPTIESAFNYIAYKSSEWGFNNAMEPDPDSIKSKALRSLDRIQSIDVVSVWIGKDALNVIREALHKLPNN